MVLGVLSGDPEVRLGLTTFKTRAFSFVLFSLWYFNLTLAPASAQGLFPVSVLRSHVWQDPRALRDAEDQIQVS